MKTSFCVHGATIVPGLVAFPILEMLSRSTSPHDRALFVRILRDYSASLREGQGEVPEDWLDALKACLENVGREERTAHLSALAKFVLGVSQPVVGPGIVMPNYGDRHISDFTRDVTKSGNERAPDPEPALDAPPRTIANAGWDGPTTARAPSEKIVDLIRDGDLDALIALTSDPLTRLGAEEIVPLVARARTASEKSGDQRLARAVLACNPIRLEMAPLFLEASSEQRWAIVLAAQRTELGRRNVGAFATIGRETIASLEYAAMTENSPEFNILLGRAIGAPVDLAARIADDPAGEPLVMALIAIGAPNDVCVRILAANDMQDRAQFQRLHTLARLSDSANPRIARRILVAIVGAQAQFATADSPKIKSAALQARGAAGPSRAEPLPAKTRPIQPRKASTVGAK